MSALKRQISRAAAAIFIFAALLTTCDLDMGLGPSVDLEGPRLWITGLELPDGTIKSIEGEENKQFIGPGILAGPGFKLKGKALDNVMVTRIEVEELDMDGFTPLKAWTNARISGRAAGDGEQDWEIVLEGIGRGERPIRVTAFDRAGAQNTAAESVKYLTLLIDTNPPVIEEIKIERQAGFSVFLLPKTNLQGLDADGFEDIDYFQNESFTIRATVDHEFSLSDIVLNLIDEQGKKLFAQGIARDSGSSLYTPVWSINADQLINGVVPELRGVYSTGRHYIKVSVTVRAEAGHSNVGFDEELYNFCWYPEADKPRIDVPVQKEDGHILVSAGETVPVKTFDDDNVGEVYAGIISIDDWSDAAKFGGKTTDNDKMEWLIAGDKYTTFTDHRGRTPFSANRLSDPIRNTVAVVDINEGRGEYRLVILARDKKEDSSAAGIWAYHIESIKVVEDGIPEITVSSPDENTAPALEDGKFTITGNVIDIDEVNALRIAWIPAGLGLTVDQQSKQGEAALIAGEASGGIKVWSITPDAPVDVEIGGKYFRKQNFSKQFNIFDDFKYQNATENDLKTFIIYTQGMSGVDVFYNYRLLAYTKPPVIEIEGFANNMREVGQDETIDFEIKAFSELGLQIKEVKLELVDPPKQITLTEHAAKDDTWTGTDSLSAKGDYTYIITAEDMLGNKAEKEVRVTVETLPDFRYVTSPHAANASFSGRETVRIQAVFSGPVNSVDGTPRIKLEGFDGNNVVRYANYVDGRGSSTLNFEYNMVAGAQDKTASAGLKATAIELGGHISANFTGRTGNTVTLSTADTIPARKKINIDGVSPRITKIEFFTNKQLEGGAIPPKYQDDYYPWHRAGEDLEVKVTTSKPVRVMGTPHLILTGFNNGTRLADFQRTEDNNTVMVFSYKVIEGDEAVTPGSIIASCFSGSDLELITDTVGGSGNFLSLGGGGQPQTTALRWTRFRLRN